VRVVSTSFSNQHEIAITVLHLHFQRPRTDTKHPRTGRFFVRNVVLLIEGVNEMAAKKKAGAKKAKRSPKKKATKKKAGKK
jgi:hypothetical protein